MITLHSGARVPVREATLLAFDDHAIPWLDNLDMTLTRADKRPENPVLRPGPPGSPDATHAIIYGSVLHIDGRFRMWYLGMFEETWDPATTGWWRPMCYAESEDGVHWVKPSLGLVELHGSRENNICLIEPAGSALARVNDFLSVMHDPEDPDPDRRYKVAYIAHIPWDEFPGGVRQIQRESRVCSMVCATSPDGLRWRVLGDRPCVAEKFEVSSLYRFGEFYYAGGQQITPWCRLPGGRTCGRVMSVYRSPDLRTWSTAKQIGFSRPGQLTDPPIAGRQTHMGAGVWNRGNVLVGLYGMWQDGPPQRPEGAPHLWGTRVDLGLVTSDDGVHWREPVPDFRVIEHGSEGEWDSAALTQGHAFANVGDQTYIWYAHWDCEWQGRLQAVGLATMRRDGFGHLSLRHPDMPGHAVTCLVDPGRQGARLLVNVDGVSVGQPLRVELLDAQDRPLPGYSGPDAALVTEPGVRQEVRWPGAPDQSLTPPEPFAVKLELPARGDARVYAIYVAEDER